MSPGDGVRPDELAPGQGAIVRSGLKKLAVYRDADGMLSACSAVCTHLGCIVRWNDQPSTWDCPCHGSRFAPDGAVLHGPAIGNLEPVDEETIAALARPTMHTGAASDERARAELAAAEERHQWDVRVFTERQQSIPLACEVPVLIEQRLFELGRAIRTHMSE